MVKRKSFLVEQKNEDSILCFVMKIDLQLKWKSTRLAAMLRPGAP